MIAWGCYYTGLLSNSPTIQYMQLQYQFNIDWRINKTVTRCSCYAPPSIGRAVRILRKTSGMSPKQLYEIWIFGIPKRATDPISTVSFEGKQAAALEDMTQKRKKYCIVNRPKIRMAKLIRYGHTSSRPIFNPENRSKSAFE